MLPLEKEKGWGHRMNKQQLAQKIWASANQMRSKIEANEYKDYILGFIFYKYLSDKEVKFLKENDYDNELLKTVSEEDAETVEWIQKNIGTLLPIRIFSPLGSRWVRTLMFQMSVMLFLHLAD